MTFSENNPKSIRKVDSLLFSLNSFNALKLLHQYSKFSQWNIHSAVLKHGNGAFFFIQQQLPPKKIYLSDTTCCETAFAFRFH